MYNVCFWTTGFRELPSPKKNLGPEDGIPTGKTKTTNRRYAAVWRPYWFCLCTFCRHDIGQLLDYQEKRVPVPRYTEGMRE